MVRVLESGVGRQHRAGSQVGQQVSLVQERSSVGPLAGVGTVAHQPRAVRQQLGQRGRCHLRMQPRHVSPHGIVELPAPFFSQLEHGRCGEGL